MTWSGSFALPRLLLAIFSVAVFLGWGGGTPVQAQTPASCDTSYTQAQEAYYAASFETAIALLRPCAQQPALPDSARARMYRLLSFVYLGQNDQNAARKAVESLLDLRPAYTPNPAQDRPDFVSIVRTAKEERTAQNAEDGNRRWLRWVLGAAAATALSTAVALVLGGGGGAGDEADPLPRPEPPPE
ncbi:MAG: hypothetical protein V5A20_00545 [Salinibacter sp.]|jgi:hypothetical protein